MKKLFLIILAAVTALYGERYFPSPFAAAEQTDGGAVRYTADLSAGKPDDWSAYAKGDPTHTTLNASENGITIKHANSGAAAANYYGGAYKVAEKYNTVSDFELSFTYRVVSYVDTGRWIGLLYHTKYDENEMLSGFMMNYRAKGMSAQSTVTATPSFRDALVKENIGIQPIDGEFHTLKIIADGTKVTHFIDETKIVEYDTADYTRYLGDERKYGGFGLIVNNCEIEIKEMSFTGTRAEILPEKAPVDETLADCYQAETGLVAPPTVVAYIDKATDLVDLKKSVRASTAILRVDGEMNILGGEGKKLGVTFADIYEAYLSGKVIPAVCVEDMATAEAVADYFDYRLNLLDLEIVSKSAEVLSYFRARNSKIRAIYDWTAETVTSARWEEVVAETNKAGANVALLRKEDATTEAVRYIQGRLKTVWTDVRGGSELEIARAVISGAYGLVTQAPKQAYECFSTLAENGTALNRVPYNVAHRGLCVTEYENSIEAFDAAYQSGATHIELDVQLSRDGRLVVMHDADIKTTTNGTGAISELTAAELAQYKIIRNIYGQVLGEGVKIPLLDEVFQYFSDTDLMFAIEIKAASADAVGALKKSLEQYGMAGRCFVISFNEAQLAQMRAQLPEIPTASLGELTVSNFAERLYTMGSLNTACSNSYGNAFGGKLARMLCDRGYMSWYWTYNTYGELSGAIASGVTGITNNVADSVKDCAAELVYQGRYAVVKDFYGELGLDFVSFSERVLPDKVRAAAVTLEEHGNFAYAIFTAEFASADGICRYQLFSQPIKLVLEKAYVSPAEMKRILAKNGSDLTDDEIVLLKRMPAAYELLEEDERAGIDETRIQELLAEIEKPPETSSKTFSEAGKTDGCGSELTSSALTLSIGALVATCALLFEAKRKKKR